MDMLLLLVVREEQRGVYLFSVCREYKAIGDGMTDFAMVCMSRHPYLVVVIMCGHAVF